MHKRAPLLSVLISVLRAMSAQDQDDFLVPSEGYFTSYTHTQDYHPAVRKALLSDLSVTPLARVIVLPSFAPEYVISVEITQGQPTLWYRQTRQQIWGQLQRQEGAPAQVDTHFIAIAPETAAAIGYALNRAVDQAHYPAPRQTMRSDGTTFHCLTFRAGIGLRGGSTWSPAAGTSMAALAELVDGLRRLAKQDAQVTEAALLAQANALTARLK
ncbi:hypothetical protein GCM10027048_04350 [Hymenobacter coalescens]